MEPSPNAPIAGLPAPEGWEDPLSGLEGPDFWRRVLVSELARTLRYGRPLTAVLMEVHGLDALAVAWGPDVVRSTVRATGQCLRRTSRTSDHVVRVGLTRFGVVLTETDEIAAINFVERVRAGMPESLPRGAADVRLSFGWASPVAGESAEAWVRRAERRLDADR